MSQRSEVWTKTDDDGNSRTVHVPVIDGTVKLTYELMYDILIELGFDIEEQSR